MAKHVEQSILNVGFGVLNPMKESMSGKYFDSDNTKPLDIVGRTTIDHFSENILEKAGQLVGVVLRVDGYTQQGFVDPNGYAATSTLQVRDLSQASAPNLLQLRVRIPELHAHLPVPEGLPDATVESEDHNIINMYPCFVAKSEVISQQVPEPGSLVWVDFQNRSTYQGPIYHGMVEGEGNPKSLRGILQEDGSVLFEGGGYTSAGGALSNAQTTVFSSEDTIVSLSPSVPMAPPGFVFKRSQLRKLKQNRVRKFAYGNCKSEGPPLVSLPGGATAHPLVAKRLEAMNELWSRWVTRNNYIGKLVPKGNGNGTEAMTNTLEVSNGFRGKNPQYSLDNGGFRAWCRSMLHYYRERESIKTCKQASVLRAFASPHETGLAIDFTNNGLKAVSKTMSAQAKSPAFRFLVLYGWLFGFYLYNGETWHWELQVPRDAWKSGKEFAPALTLDSKYGYLEPLEIVSSKPTVMDPLSFLKEEENTFSGEEYDWLAGEEFPYAIWVEEKVKASGVLTSSGQFAGIRTYTPGAETFRLPRGIG